MAKQKTPERTPEQIYAVIGANPFKKLMMISEIHLFRWHAKAALCGVRFPSSTRCYRIWEGDYRKWGDLTCSQCNQVAEKEESGGREREKIAA